LCDDPNDYDRSKIAQTRCEQTGITAESDCVNGNYDSHNQICSLHTTPSTTQQECTDLGGDFYEDTCEQWASWRTHHGSAKNMCAAGDEPPSACCGTAATICEQYYPALCAAQNEYERSAVAHTSCEKTGVTDPADCPSGHYDDVKQTCSLSTTPSTTEQECTTMGGDTFEIHTCAKWASWNTHFDTEEDMCAAGRVPPSECCGGHETVCAQFSGGGGSGGAFDVCDDESNFDPNAEASTNCLQDDVDDCTGQGHYEPGQRRCYLYTTSSTKEDDCLRPVADGGLGGDTFHAHTCADWRSWQTHYATAREMCSKDNVPSACCGGQDTVCAQYEHDTVLGE